MEICEQAIQLFQPICLLMQEKQVWIGTPKQFKEIICLHFPDEFAAKITAGRQKDLDDCAILLPKTKIRTRKQAQQVLDRYILPSGQQKNAESIENALNRLFGRGA